MAVERAEAKGNWIYKDAAITPHGLEWNEDLWGVGE